MSPPTKGVRPVMLFAAGVALMFNAPGLAGFFIIAYVLTKETP